jgi:hypothetical protein
MSKRLFWFCSIIERMTDEQMDFFRYWFGGFEHSLDELDEAARARILGNCGRACAQSYTVSIFREVWQASASFEDFLQRLSRRLPDGHYELIGANTLRATYNRCGCDLVGLGFVKSPALCECSAANLRENLEAVIGKPVAVVIENSILRGAEKCLLTATIEPDRLCD